ncbi:hypothetical protein [Megasphaera sp.]
MLAWRRFDSLGDAPGVACGVFRHGFEFQEKVVVREKQGEEAAYEEITAH